MYIAIDIGGTNTRVASFKEIDPKTKIGYKKIPTNQDFKKGFEEIKNIIVELSGAAKIDSIGISMALPLNEHKETAFTVNLSDWGWDALKIEEYLKDKFQTNIKVMNDASAGALGELIAGNHDYTDFIFLAWGTGFGGVYIKKEQNNISIYEFEPGHLIIIDDGRECICGKKGCLQAYVGGRAIQGIYNKDIKAIDNTEWADVLDYMRTGINQILLKHPVNPIIFDGKVILEHPDFVKTLEGTVNDDYPTWVNFEKSTIGDEAPLYGALISLRQDLKFQFHKKF